MLIIFLLFYYTNSLFSFFTPFYGIRGEKNNRILNEIYLNKVKKKRKEKLINLESIIY